MSYEGGRAPSVPAYTITLRSQSFCCIQSFSCLPASRIAFSPSTRTHHPSPPRVPSANPPTAAPGNSLIAYSSSASLKLPGCNQTALTPASLASFKIFSVTGGGVMTDLMLRRQGQHMSRQSPYCNTHKLVSRGLES